MCTKIGFFADLVTVSTQWKLCHTSLETRSCLKAWPVASIRAGRLPRHRLSRERL